MWLSSCRLVTQITVVFTLMVCLGVLSSLLFLHCGVVAFFLFICLDASGKCTQKLFFAFWPGACSSCVWLVTIGDSAHDLCENSACSF